MSAYFNYYFITVRELTYPLQSAFISNDNVKIEQLYLNDRAKYCVSGMKQNGNVAHFFKNNILHESYFFQVMKPSRAFLTSSYNFQGNYIMQYQIFGFHMVMYTLCVIFFPCSEKFFELDSTSLHTNVNCKKTPRKLTVKPFSYSPTLHSLSYLHSVTSHTPISILHLNNPQLSP